MIIRSVNWLDAVNMYPAIELNKIMIDKGSLGIRKVISPLRNNVAAPSKKNCKNKVIVVSMGFLLNVFTDSLPQLSGM
ncbi:hypothetical protein BSG1_16260 [Bacillus sp. SG-1]|nr:hypothetical protein BSG1_16260 [Bacillus sp. SG-1]